MTTRTSYQPTQEQNDHARRWLPLIQPLTQAWNRTSRAIAALTQAGKAIPQDAADLLADLDAATKASAILYNDTDPTRAQAAQAQAPQLRVIIETSSQTPPGKLADASIAYLSGPLAGLKLIGFSIWERRTGNGRNVTFPARQYSINGERRSFALLRPDSTQAAELYERSSEACRQLILDAYDHHDATQENRPTAHAPSAWTYDSQGRCLDDRRHSAAHQDPPRRYDPPQTQTPAQALAAALDTAQAIARAQEAQHLDDGNTQDTTQEQDTRDRIAREDAGAAGHAWRDAEAPSQDEPKAQIGFTQAQPAAALQARATMSSQGGSIAAAITQATYGSPGPMPPRPRRF